MMKHVSFSLLMAAGTLALAGAGAAIAQDEPAAEEQQVMLTVQTSPEHGEYIADAEGRALYMFEADQRGVGAADAVSNCYDACAEAWPPLLTEAPPTLGEELDVDLVAEIERRDGAMQVSYGGWPLYYYVQDQGAGETTGHDIEGFGGEWYLVSPAGEIVGHEPATTSSTNSLETAPDTMDTAVTDAESRVRAMQSAESAGMTNLRILDRVFVLEGTTAQGETVYMIVNPPGAVIGLSTPDQPTGANQQ